MKETGIIMSGNHPRLVLDGIKTMTRRVIIPQPDIEMDTWLEHPIVSKLGEVYQVGEVGRRWVVDKKGNPLKCPYGQVGDRLIIIEAWATEYQFDQLKPSEIPHTARIYYLCDDLRGFPFVGRRRSARFMCNWMSRARPEITEVRVERLQEITEADAIAEGMIKGQTVKLEGGGMSWPQSCRGVFHLTWDFLNAKRGYGWDKNNWVWPIRFRRIKL